MRVGIWFIDFLIVYLTVYYTFVAVLRFFNEYYDGYYPVILLLALVPLYVAFVLFYIYTNATSKSGRNKLFYGVILAIVSLILWLTWEFVYFCCIYE